MRKANRSSGLPVSTARPMSGPPSNPGPRGGMPMLWNSWSVSRGPVWHSPQRARPKKSRPPRIRRRCERAVVSPEKPVEGRVAQQPGGADESRNGVSDVGDGQERDRPLGKRRGSEGIVAGDRLEAGYDRIPDGHGSPSSGYRRGRFLPGGHASRIRAWQRKERLNREGVCEALREGVARRSLVARWRSGPTRPSQNRRRQLGWPRSKRSGALRGVKLPVPSSTDEPRGGVPPVPIERVSRSTVW